MDAVSNEGGNERGGGETRAMDGRDSTGLDGTRRDSESESESESESDEGTESSECVKRCDAND